MRRDHERTEPVAEPTRAMRPPRAKKPPLSMTRGFAERLALFVNGVDRERSEELLSGLTEVTRKRALSFATEANVWDSATRQGRMAVAFGNHPRAAERLQQLMSDASPALRATVLQRLAPWQKSLFEAPVAAVPPTAATPAMDALADRLIREATR